MSSSPQTDQTADASRTDLDALKALQGELDGVQSRDAPRLHKRLAGLTRRIRQGKPVDRGLAEIRREIERSRGKVEARAARPVHLDYPAELPVSERREDILAALRDHQVVVVAGETGSGKTTQLPKLCLELGLGQRGLVGHTQPRRLAARSVATRLAEEMQVPLGEQVGYQVRFTDQTAEATRVKLMTDG
ncbi:ATP-dependent RNA helicase HrpA, partial [Halomonas elongata]|nr:ATP-dependent RNA helicase HrpA [Halomonas elongata]